MYGECGRAGGDGEEQADREGTARRRDGGCQGHQTVAAGRGREWQVHCGQADEDHPHGGIHGRRVPTVQTYSLQQYHTGMIRTLHLAKPN